MVEFEAVFSNFGRLDDDDRSEVEALEQIIGRYLEIDDFEIELSSMGYDVVIEGVIPLTADVNTASPYYVLVSQQSARDGTLLVQFSRVRMH